MQDSVSENVFTGKNIKTIIRLFLVTVVLHDHHPPKPHMAGSLLCDYTVACAVSKRKGGSSYMEKVFSDCTATSCHCGVRKWFFWLSSFSPNLLFRGLLNQWFLHKTEAKEEIIFWEVNDVFPTETGSRPNPVSSSWELPESLNVKDQGWGSGSECGWNTEQAMGM